MQKTDASQQDQTKKGRRSSLSSGLGAERNNAGSLWLARGRDLYSECPLLRLLPALAAADDDGVQAQVAALGIGTSGGSVRGLHGVRGKRGGRDLLGLVGFRHRQLAAVDIHPLLLAPRLGDARGRLAPRKKPAPDAWG